MQLRHVLRVALCCGAMGALGGQTVQAQPTDPTPFVQLLLMRETNQINKEVADIAKQDSLSSVLNSTGSLRLVRTIDNLQNRINNRTSLLFYLQNQLTKTLRGIRGPNPFTAQAAANAAIIRALAARPVYGIPAATTSQ
jgi:hypothetical protein